MTEMCYATRDASIGFLLNWIQEDKIAIPEIQRPFVWDAVDVRDFLDSLFRGYPVGYLITWQNPDVKGKDGIYASGKYIIIDGQQRAIALMASLLGREVVDKNYRKKRICIAFNPIEKKFEVRNPAIAKDTKWIDDVSLISRPFSDHWALASSYCERNPGTTMKEVFESIQRLENITFNSVGLIELNSKLDMGIVTEIFIRVNSKQVPLSQADFAMSKIAVNEKYGGNMLRKAIDYFCHLAVTPAFYFDLQKDIVFKDSEFFHKMSWLHDKKFNLYNPSYSDMLRVAFTTEFKRGPLKDLVALLSGRDFETKQYEEAIVEDSFKRLKSSINRYMNEFDFNQFIIHIQSAGFVTASMISSQNALNFAYIIYLTLRGQNWDDAEIQHYVRRWFAMSLLTGRYSGSPESKFDEDIKKIHEYGIKDYFNSIVQSEISESFWNVGLPEALKTSAASSPYFHLYQAAQINTDDKGFLSDKTTVGQLINIQSDVHHLFPRGYLKNKGKNKSEYNQVANYVVCEKPINTAIGNKEPREYFMEIIEQCNGGKKKYGNIADLDRLHENFSRNCIPEYCISKDDIAMMTVDGYSDFLAERRKLMSQKIKMYFNGL